MDGGTLIGIPSGSTVMITRATFSSLTILCLFIIPPFSILPKCSDSILFVYLVSFVPTHSHTHTQCTKEWNQFLIYNQSRERLKEWQFTFCEIRQRMQICQWLESRWNWFPVYLQLFRNTSFSIYKIRHFILIKNWWIASRLDSTRCAAFSDQIKQMSRGCVMVLLVLLAHWINCNAYR